MKRLGFALFLLIALESCDAINRVEGIVYSASTNLPIEGAIVEMIDQNQMTQTDKTVILKFKQLPDLVLTRLSE